MRLQEELDASALLSEAQALFATREVEGNLVLGILHAISRGLYPDPAPWLWSVREGARLRGVVLRTPPHPLASSPLPSEACALLAMQLLERGLLPIELNGPRAVVEGVVSELAARGPIQTQVIGETRLFELRQVIWPARPSGGMRLARAADLPLLVNWLHAFEAEAVPHEAGRIDLTARAKRLLDTGAAFLWEDAGACVAFAAFNRRVGRGVSIAPVYTPQELRRRGYATALVAALSQQLLDEGCEYTSLFTDLANPTSNSIYPKVGYRPVFDMRYVRLSSPTHG
jgi:uncharacterized protein